MKNKTLITMMTAFALSAAIMPINAENMYVEYTEQATYEFTIPATVELSKSGITTKAMEVKNVNLVPQTKINVILENLNDEGKVELTNKKSENDKAYSTISVGETQASNGVVASFEKNGTKDITFSAITGENDEAVKAGTYSTILTFTASIVDSSN